MGDPTKMVEYAKMRSVRRERQVLEVIDTMLRDGVPVNFNSVQVYTRSSKSFLYRNKAISERIRYERDRRK